MRRYSALVIFIVVIAILSIFGGAYLYYRSIPIFNDFSRARVMVNQTEKKQYNELVEELNEKYLVSFSDIFDDAKHMLVKKAEDVLGEEYKAIKKQIEDKRQEITSIRETFSASKELNDLKDKLALIKERLIEADMENKPAIKEEMSVVLNEITKKNLDNFSLMSAKRKEIDELIKNFNQIIENKKGDIDGIEQEVVADAKIKTANLAVAYKTEIDALSKVFNIDNYSSELPFIKSINLNARLVDFDKNIFLDAYHKKNSACSAVHSCSGNCHTCHEHSNGFDSKEIDNNNN